jgi:hypothetical protein
MKIKRNGEQPAPTAAGAILRRACDLTRGEKPGGEKLPRGSA